MITIVIQTEEDLATALQQIAEQRATTVEAIVYPLKLFPAF